MTAILAWLACTCQPDPAITSAFAEAEARALAAPGPPGEDWTPDLVLHLGSATVAELVEAGLAEADRAVSREVPVGLGITVGADLELTGVVLGPGGCARCMEATASLAGTVGWTHPALGKGSVPVDVRAVLDVEIETDAAPKAYVIRAVPRTVRSVDLSVPRLPASLLDHAEPKVREWVADGLADVPPFRIAQIARTEVPVRAFRIRPEGAGLRVEMLSEANDPGRVPIRDPGLTSGWQLDASARSVLAIARREAFARPHQPFDLVPVPESLAIDGSRFSLGLRLWRLSAPGWWRDYTATGTVEVVFGEIELSAERVDEGARSPGAGRADPLALLAEGVIVDTITGVLQRTVPASGATTVRGYRAEVAVERIGGRKGTIEVGGSLAVRK